MPHKRTISVLAAAFISALTTSAQVPENQRTGDLLNGRFWVANDNHTAKVLFLYGFLDALNTRSDIPSPAILTYFSKATFDETVKGLDQFYSDPANDEIPIALALNVFTDKVKGATPEALAAETAEMRRRANAPASQLAKPKPPRAALPAALEKACNIKAPGGNIWSWNPSGSPGWMNQQQVYLQQQQICLDDFKALQPAP